MNTLTPTVELLFVDGHAVEVQIPAGAYPGDLTANAAALGRLVAATAHAVAIAARHETDADKAGQIALAMQAVALIADLQQLCLAEAKRRSAAAANVETAP